MPRDEVADILRDQEADKEAFFEYQETFRGSVADRLEIENEWSRKTVAERERIAEAFDGVIKADEDYGRAEDPIDEQLRYIRKAMANPVRDLGYLSFVIAEVLERMEVVSQAAATLELAYRELAIVEHEQWASSDPRNPHHAEDRANHWEEVVKHYEGEIQAWGRIAKEKQPVPLNGKGEERVPEDWLGRLAPDDEDRAKASIAADRAINRSGLDERRPNVTWKAWRECGGMSDGCLWLCFDDTTGLVIDVSEPTACFEP